MDKNFWFNFHNSIKVQAESCNSDLVYMAQTLIIIITTDGIIKEITGCVASFTNFDISSFLISFAVVLANL